MTLSLSSIRKSASRLTNRGWFLVAAAVVCFVVAYGTGRGALLYAASFLALLPLVALLFIRLRRLRLSVVRTFSPTIVAAGSVAAVELLVRNTSRSASGPATWADRIPWSPGTAGPGALPGLSAALGAAGTPGTEGTSTVLKYSVRPPTRGVFSLGPLEVEYADPFGLARGRSSLAGVQSLSVVPAIVPLGGGPSIIAGDGSARLVQRRSSGSDDDLMTREYRSGDAMRRVHWRASARHGELMVRQEEQRTYPEARILIDTRRGGYSDVWLELGGENGENSAFEWSVRMLATLGSHLHRSGFLVEVLETAPAQVTPLGSANSGTGLDLEFLVSLASIAMSSAPPPGAPGGVEQHQQGLTGPIFAVLADPDETTLQWIATQRKSFELGVAFVVGESSSRAVERLAQYGWTCVPVGVTDDPGLAWASITRFSSAAAPMQGSADERR